MKESLRTASSSLSREVNYSRTEFSIQFTDHNLRDQLWHAEKEGQNNERQVNYTTPEKLKQNKTKNCNTGHELQQTYDYMQITEGLT